MGKKATPRKNPARGRLATYGIVLAFLVGTAAILFFFYGEVLYAPPPVPLSMITRLNIVVENSTGGLQQVLIPAGIGVDAGLWNYHGLDQYGANGQAPIVTRDTYGIVLVQSNVRRDYTLGDFFKIWGKTFNSTCIEVDQLYCNGGLAQYQVSLYVNGSLNEEYDAYVLRDQDVLRIEYKSQAI